MGVRRNTIAIVPEWVLVTEISYAPYALLEKNTKKEKKLADKHYYI